MQDMHLVPNIQRQHASRATCAPPSTMHACHIALCSLNCVHHASEKVAFQANHVVSSLARHASSTGDWSGLCWGHHQRGKSRFASVAHPRVWEFVPEVKMNRLGLRPGTCRVVRAGDPPATCACPRGCRRGLHAGCGCDGRADAPVRGVLRGPSQRSSGSTKPSRLWAHLSVIQGREKSWRRTNLRFNARASRSRQPTSTIHASLFNRDTAATRHHGVGVFHRDHHAANATRQSTNLRRVVFSGVAARFQGDVGCGGGQVGVLLRPAVKALTSA